MRRVQNRRRRIDWWSYISPEAIHDSIKKLTVLTDTTFDAYWQFALGMSPASLERMRTQQKIFLAARGRQSLIQWGNTDVIEIQDYADSMLAFVKGNSSVEDAMDDDL